MIIAVARFGHLILYVVRRGQSSGLWPCTSSHQLINVHANARVRNPSNKIFLFYTPYSAMANLPGTPLVTIVVALICMLVARAVIRSRKTAHIPG